MWQAWAIKHDSHGLFLDNLVFLPKSEIPETNEAWVRCPWLDSPEGIDIEENSIKK